MKRIRIILALALMVSAAACTVNYDEGPVNDKINDLTSQIAELEQLVAAKNAERIKKKAEMFAIVLLKIILLKIIWFILAMVL